MNAMNKTLLYSAGLAASFVLGLWFSSGRAPVAPPAPIPAVEKPEIKSAPSAPLAAIADAPRPDAANVYALIATDPRSAMDEAMRLSGATRLTTLQNIMAVWLRTDRLAAAEWMMEKRGLREFEPLSAQVSDAFFPDDTEMSATFSFDLTDATLRDVRVNKTVAYWKSGAHLKFDNSPWEVDGPGTGPAKPPATTAPSAQPSSAPATENTAKPNSNHSE